MRGARRGFGRRRLPPALVEAKRRFRAVLAEVERSIGVLTQAAPTTRYDGRPLAEVLAGFDDGLATASERMGSWRVPEVEDTWDACDAGIREARARCARLRSEAPQIRGFEAIIGTIDALIAPLEAFEAAAERFEDLRR